jgi:Cellulase (glycosyl hydrolase family 5)
MFRIITKILVILFFIALTFFAFLNLPGPKPREDVVLGMTFSSRYAQDLGLDWRETYQAMLSDMGVRKVRLPAYWDLIEREQGTYNFADLDWQIEEAGRYDADVIVTVGQRVPRWPECHIPEWAKEDEQLRRKSLLRMIQTTVERYKDNPTVINWQVENEPYLSLFGICPPLDPNFLTSEIALVHELDPTRKVIVTDSGELSVWYKAADQGDIFGTTLYRDIYQKRFGYVTYPIGPYFFKMKELWTRALTDQEHFMVIELQAEPWANGWVGTVPIEEQFITMNEKKLVENVTYARRVGFEEIYLWGVEWWYWMKVEKNYPALWDTGKELFAQYGTKK